MQQRSLGRSGLQVSALGLGCNNFGMAIDGAQSAEVVASAIDAGVTLFDTADFYGQGQSETFLGKALGKRRGDVIVATKFGQRMGSGLRLGGGTSRRYIMHAVEASLRRLETDYIDLYQIHSPDPQTPIEETIRALDDLIQQGKIRYAGHSNFAGWQTVEAALVLERSGKQPFITAQNRYSLLSRQIEQELVPACLKYGVSILPYFPLESGLLTGKYAADQPPGESTRMAAWAKSDSAFTRGMFAPEKFQAVKAYEGICTEFGCTLLELAIGWLLAQRVVGSVIAGATTVEQVISNARAARWTPSPQQCARINEVHASLRSAD